MGVDGGWWQTGRNRSLAIAIAKQTRVCVCFVPVRNYVSVDKIARFISTGTSLHGGALDSVRVARVYFIELSHSMNILPFVCVRSLPRRLPELCQMCGCAVISSHSHTWQRLTLTFACDERRSNKKKYSFSSAPTMPCRVYECNLMSGRFGNGEKKCCEIAKWHKVY